MRHGKRFNHLGRKAAHRKAMLANLASSLILHKRINTTVAKAKELRKFVEPLITKAKNDTTHSRRIVFSYLKHKEPVKELFEVVAPKVGDRPGGYTRIIKTGYRLGDNAETCMMELVDFNEIYTKEPKKKATRRSRSRRGGKKTQEKVTTTTEKASTSTEKEIVESESKEENAATPKVDKEEKKAEEKKEVKAKEKVENPAETKTENAKDTSASEEQKETKEEDNKEENS